MKKGWQVERLYKVQDTSAGSAQRLTGFIMSESVITHARTRIRVGKAPTETCQVCWLEMML